MSSIEPIKLFLRLRVAQRIGANRSAIPRMHIISAQPQKPLCQSSFLPPTMSNYLKHENNHHPIVVWCKSTEIPYAASIKKLLSPRPVTVRQFDQGPFANEVSQKLRQLGAEESKLAVFVYGNYLGGYKEVLELVRRGGDEIDRLFAAGEESISHTSATEDMSSSETEAQGYASTRSQRQIFKQMSPRRHPRCSDADRERATAATSKSSIHHAKNNPFSQPQLTRNQSTLPGARSRSQSFNQTWGDGLSGGLVLSFRCHSF